MKLLTLSLGFICCLLTNYVHSQIYGSNLIINGDFELGPIGRTSFFSQYTWGGTGSMALYSEGTYSITTNPNSVHPDFGYVSQHTPGGQYMMVVNGASTRQIAWQQTVAVKPNTCYRFSAWGRALSGLNPAQLQFIAGAAIIGNVFQLSYDGEWQNFSSTWNSGSSVSVTISLYDNQLGADGNDFAIDDIALQEIVKPGTVALSACKSEGKISLTATTGNITDPVYQWEQYTNGVGWGNIPLAPSTSSAITVNVLSNVSQYRVTVKNKGDVSINGSGCPVAAATIAVPDITSTPAPEISNASGCLQMGDVSFSTGSGVFKWYDANKILLPAAPKKDATATGTWNYFVSEVLRGCESDLAPVAITVNPVPVKPSVTSISLCNDNETHTLSADGIAGATIKWYSVTNELLPAAPTTNGTYSATQTLGGCESAHADGSIAIRIVPAAPTITNISQCDDGVTHALTATIVEGATLTWYDTDKTALPTAPTANGTYYAKQALNECESDYAAGSIAIRTTPSAPIVTNISQCDDGATHALTATLLAGATVTWYDENKVLLTETPIANGIYYARQTLNECESDYGEGNIAIRSVPAAPTIISVSQCDDGQVHPLTATIVEDATLTWYDANKTALPTTPTTNGTYYAKQALNECESDYAAGIIAIRSVPAAPTITSISQCDDGVTHTLTATIVEDATLTWYDTDKTALPTAPTANGTYYAKQALNECESDYTAGSIAIRTRPSAPIVTSISQCDDGQVHPLTATIVEGAALIWYDANKTTLPTAPTANGTYYAKQILNECESEDALAYVDIKSKSPIPQVNDANACQAQNKILQLSAKGENLQWYGDDDNMLQVAPEIDLSRPANYIYYVSGNANGCESDKARIMAIVKPSPSITVLQQQPPACNGYLKGRIEVSVNAYESNDIRFTLSPSNIIQASGLFNNLNEGIYIVSAKATNGCSSNVQINLKHKGDCDLLMPSAFSPNGDGKNDVFRPAQYGTISQYSLMVYNRWGGLLYRGSDPAAGWDGTLNAQLQPQGTYVWVVKYVDNTNTPRLQKGTLVLIR